MATLNARAGAVALVIGGGGAAFLKLSPINLTPMLILFLAVTSFGVWAFADEMGVRKPLNRAGLVAFCFAAAAKTMALVGGTASDQAKFYILYAFALLVALLSWSLAFLHRDQEMKIAGTVGAIATIVPILLLIAGHVVLGAGAVLGVGALYNLSTVGPRSDLTIIIVIEAVFLVWALITAGMLWTGRISNKPLTAITNVD